MKKMSKHLTYTKKSPFTKRKAKNEKYANSFYGRIFLEHMCSDFAIHFSPLSHHYDFFSVNPKDGMLENLLEYDNHGFLRYEFSRLLSENMHKLLLDGVCYVEIVLGFEGKELKTIKFISFDTIRCFKRKDVTRFSAINHEGKTESFTIQSHLVIKHDLTDLRIRRNFFRKILKRLASKDIPDFDWMNKIGLSLTDYNNRQILNALRTVGHTYCDLRNGDNEYMNEVYLLYRIVMHDLYRYKFFEYLLSKYNTALRQIGFFYNFTGEIICSREIEDHKKELEQLLSGEINCKKMSDYLFKINSDPS